MCEKYIRGLVHVDGKSVFDGPRKAAFMGWVNDIQVARSMYENYIITGNHIALTQIAILCVYVWMCVCLCVYVYF